MFLWFQFCFKLWIVKYKWIMRRILDFIFLSIFLQLSLLKINRLGNNFLILNLVFIHFLRGSIFLIVLIENNLILLVSIIIHLLSFCLIIISCRSNYLIHSVNLSKICYFLTVTDTFASTLNSWFFKFFFYKFLYLYIHY